MGSMFSTVMFIGVQNCQMVQPIVDIERTVLYREKGAGMYSALPYAFAQVSFYLLFLCDETYIDSSVNLCEKFRLY